MYFLTDDEAPRWRRFSSKLLFSALILAALGCGFWDTFTYLDPERNCFLNVLGTIIVTIGSFAFILTAVHMAWTYKHQMHYDRFEFKINEKAIIAINIAILCVWIISFAFSCWIWYDGRIFFLLSLSAVIAFCAFFLLMIVGMFLFLIVKGIWLLISAYTQWLFK